MSDHRFKAGEIRALTIAADAVREILRRNHPHHADVRKELEQLAVALFAQARSARWFPRPEDLEDARCILFGGFTAEELHPNGRCSCAGEGRCTWCKRYEREHDCDDPDCQRCAHPDPLEGRASLGCIACPDLTFATREEQAAHARVHEGRSLCGHKPPVPAECDFCAEAEGWPRVDPQDEGNPVEDLADLIIAASRGRS